MKIILGGVPFGSGNIGDEAILNCVIGIFRRNFPEAHLAVATFNQEATAEKFNLETLPAFGFDRNCSMRDFRKTVKKFDMFVWAGGTGLSDYPQIGADLLENAQKMGLKTVIWQVGMNREFNPEYFQLHGRILKFTELFGITGCLERQMEKRIRERLQVCVSRCDLIALRDQPSLIELHNSGEFPAAVFGADSVILQGASEGELLPPDAMNRRSVGICIAEKLNKRKFQQAVDFLRHLQITENVRLVLRIPRRQGTRLDGGGLFLQFYDNEYGGRTVWESGFARYGGGRRRYTARKKRRRILSHPSHRWIRGGGPARFRANR